MAQVDTALIFNPNAAFGPLDIRVSRSAGEYYALAEDVTFSFRSVDGARTNSYLDMTAWDSGDYREGHLKIVAGGKEGFVMNYRILFPPAYRDDLPGGYPLVLFLHGLHERGNCAGAKCYHADRSYAPDANNPPAPADASHPLYNNDYQLIHGGLNYLEANRRADGAASGGQLPDARAFPGFVLFPQSNNEWDVQEVENALRLLRLVLRKYNVDANRVAINGVSKGGYAAFEAIKRAGWMFSAAAMFSPVDDAGLTALTPPAGFAHMPMWIFQGAKDQYPSPEQTERLIDRLSDAGVATRYTLYSHLGHGTWNEGLEEADFFSWMLRWSRTDIRPRGNRAVVCGTGAEPLPLYLPPGFRRYEWFVNGQLIDSARSHTLRVNIPGEYTARFSSSAEPAGGGWEPMSPPLTVTLYAPAAPGLAAAGSTHLPDPNGTNRALLRAAEDYRRYAWSRNEKQLGAPAPSRDSANFAWIGPAMGNGEYAVRVAGTDNCLSPPSESVVLYFNDSAPLNLAAPENLTAVVEGSRGIVSWVCEAEQARVEIWRRRTDENRWILAGVVSAEQGRFTDTALAPASVYHYRLRTVSVSGRSPYAPATAEGLVLASPVDGRPPSAPDGLTVVQTGVNRAEISWTPAEDDFSIASYELVFPDSVVSVPGNDTTWRLANLAVNTRYTIRVAAYDAGGNRSANSQSVVFDNRVRGLYYYHSTGAFETLDQLTFDEPEYTGMTDYFRLDMKRQEDFFCVRFDGYLRVEESGVYQFRTTSDDGSNLSINDTLLLENNGIHTLATVTGPIHLLAGGPHRITVDYFDYMGEDSIVVEYKGPDTGNEWMAIPASALSSAEEEVPGRKTPFDFVIFPNPVRAGEVSVRLLRPLSGSVALAVYDAAGNLITETDFGTAAQRPLEFVSSLPPGMYLVGIRHNGTVVSHRLIVLP